MQRDLAERLMAHTVAGESLFYILRAVPDGQRDSGVFSP